MYKKKENYCTFSPDSLFGVRFNYACYLHDRQYRHEVKKRKTRLQADIDLKNNIIKEYEKEGRKTIGVIIALFYYYAVRLLNKRYWVK